jgi:hypothetical protein
MVINSTLLNRFLHAKIGTVSITTNVSLLPLGVSERDLLTNLILL